MIDTSARPGCFEVSCTLKVIRDLKLELAKRPSFYDKFSWVFSQESVKKTFEQHAEILSVVKSYGDTGLFLVGLLILADQFDGLVDTVSGDFQKRLETTLSMLDETDRFYASIGGLLGYMEKALQIFCGEEEHPDAVSFLPPPFYDMRKKTNDVWQSIYAGIERLPEIAELYAVGGAGDRLKLLDEITGIPVPVAYLLFCGRPLLEHLFRDLEAREYVYFRMFGKQLTTPVLLMTSQEKGNERAILDLVEKQGYFGRERATMRHVVQSLVPLIASNGKLVFQRPAELVGKPGGHGVIWKVAQDNGAFTWLKSCGAKALLVRQINNPLAGLDHALSCLMGFGLSHGKAFGFASCPRRHGLTEGLNVVVLDTKKSEATISNIEYTKFENVTKEEAEVLKRKEIPANTNILFASIEHVERALQKNPLPGLIVNAKNGCDICENKQPIPMARLEATMQNIADTMMEKVPSFDASILREGLSTFLQLYERSKLFSVTKKAYRSGNTPQETPESCFYDWYVSCHRLLEDECGFSLPPLQSIEEFLEEGPRFLFFFHPALGPFWEVIAQKLRKGKVTSGSELELEIAEMYMEDVSLDGSLRILGSAPPGHVDEKGVRRYSLDPGRAFLKNVVIENRGLSHGSISAHVKRCVMRRESCTISLEGTSEVVAKDLSIVGDFHLVVPHGKRAILSQGRDGQVVVSLEPYISASWCYDWQWKTGEAPMLFFRE